MLMVRNEDLRVKYHFDYNSKTDDVGIFIEGSAPVGADLFMADVYLSKPLDEDSEWFRGRMDEVFGTRFRIFDSVLYATNEDEEDQHLIYTFAAYIKDYSLSRLIEIIEGVATAIECYIGCDNEKWLKEHGYRF